MNFSYPTIQALFGLTSIGQVPDTETGFKPGEYLQGLLQMVANSAKPKGQRKNIGPTHPLHGEFKYNRTRTHEYSKSVQFPDDEKLPDGRHRYFLKDGEYIDRLN